MDEHLAARKSLWLKKKDLGVYMTKNEDAIVISLVNQLANYVANQHEDDMLHVFGCELEESKDEEQKVKDSFAHFEALKKEFPVSHKTSMVSRIVYCLEK